MGVLLGVMGMGIDIVSWLVLVDVGHIYFVGFGVLTIMYMIFSHI